MNKKNIIITLLLVLSLLIITIGVSIAFFNYTRTGSENVLAVGRIYFNSSQGTSINLTNVFPIKSTELENNSNVSSVTLTITGDTTYDGGLEYLVSADQVDNTVNGKKVPIGTSVTVNNLGTVDASYFENRGGNSSIYKIISKSNIKEDGKLVVGYIAKGSTGVNGSITVSAWLDGDKLAVSDTYDETESDNMGTTNEWVGDRTVLTTTEWNSLGVNGVSFKLKVEADEGVWVDETLTALEIIKNNVNTTTQINFANNSGSSNGEGLYILPGTENNANPIYYYRGAINDNNVFFAGFCWKMIRTTDTGGIKMIYNGTPDVSSDGDNPTYDCGTTRTLENAVRASTNLNHSTGYFYADDYEIVSTTPGSAIYQLKSKTNPITQVEITGGNASTAINTIASNYPYTCKETTSDATCKVLYKVDSYASGTNANSYSTIDRTIIGRSAFNTSSNSLAYIGYMYNEVYPINSGAPVSGAYFAGDTIYGDFDSNGTNEYRLISSMASTTLDTTHHYTCNLTTPDGTCTTIRYYYYNSGSDYYYIELTSGEKIEDALYKMTGNGGREVIDRNIGYNLNVNNSTIKTFIDNWFRTNLTSEVNTNNPDYSLYLEDTVYCDDRSFKTEGENTGFPTYLESGWNKSGGNLTKYLYFGIWNRLNNNYYSTSNVPDLTCSNKVDRYTVSRAKGNGSLTYPVGLLSGEEEILAGVGGNNTSSGSYYLYTGEWYWSMVPRYFSSTNAVRFDVDNYFYGYNAHFTCGIRPVISLKSEIEFESSGDGTGTNPYIVKYN